MEINLLLRHVTHDQHAQIGERQIFGWMHGPASGGDGNKEKKRENDGPERPEEPDTHEDEGEDRDPEAQTAKNLARFALRKESVGGVVVLESTQQVFLADEEAYGLLARIKQGETLDDIRTKFVVGEMPKFAHFEEMTNRLGILVECRVAP